MRSWLIVPADSEAKLSKVAEVGADVVVIDLVGDHPSEVRDAARERAREFLSQHGKRGAEGLRLSRWVRIASLDSTSWRDDLVAVLPGGPDGIVLSHARDATQVQALAAEIYGLEQRSGLGHGQVRIVPQVAATAAAALTVAGFAGEVHPRLAGLAWDAGELSAALGARRLRGRDGGWIDPLRYARAEVLLAARARGLMAIDTAHARVRDAACIPAASRTRDSASGRLARA